MLFASRSGHGPDPLYPFKAIALVTGIGLFLVGVRLEAQWLTWVGLGVLGVALVLRVMGRSGGSESGEDR